ncbi:hypothetical protein IWZ00DRAFT_513100 [Phyllosticta capitalensis]
MEIQLARFFALLLESHGAAGLSHYCSTNVPLPRSHLCSCLLDVLEVANPIRIPRNAKQTRKNVRSTHEGRKKTARKHDDDSWLPSTDFATATPPLMEGAMNNSTIMHPVCLSFTTQLLPILIALALCLFSRTSSSIRQP